MTIPSDDQIRADAVFLGFTDKDTDRLLEHARRARTGTTELDGYKRSHGAAGGRGSDDSSPVERLVLTDGDGYDKDGEPEPKSASFRTSSTPEVEKQHALLFDMLGQSAASKRAVRNTLERLSGVQEWRKPQGHTSTECKSDDCDGPAVARGWCNACRMWVDRHRKDGEPDPLTVPAHVIEERTKRREKAC